MLEEPSDDDDEKNVESIVLIACASMKTSCPHVLRYHDNLMFVVQAA